MIPALTFATYAITLDGKPVLPHARAAVVGGRVLLPVRALGNALGADVGYDAQTHRIVIQQGARVVSMAASGAVRVVNGHAYAPLRAAANAFALDVAYESASRTVALSHGNTAYERAPATPDPYASAAAAARTYTAPPQRLSIETTPSDGARIHDPYPSISARFAGANIIDRRSLRVVLDGRDVSAEAALIGDQVLLTPRTALLPGTHDVAITASTLNGEPLSALWQFVDTFAFSNAPPPTPYPISAIYIDRYITPGTNAFDVIVQGAPGITGFVGVDGVGLFPLQVYSNNGYVAHVVVPYGVFQPYARVAARLTLPNGTSQTIVLPQSIPLVTVTPSPVPQPPARTPIPRYVPTPEPTATPIRRRSVDIPTPAPTPTPATRAPLLKPRAPATVTPRPAPSPGMTPSPTPTPSATPSATASPGPSPKPRRRAPLAKPRPTPAPSASPSA